MRSTSTDPRLAPRASWAIPIMAVALLLSSCISAQDDGGADAGGGEEENEGNGDGQDGQGGEEGPVATSLTSATVHKSDMQVDVMSLERHGDEFAILTMRVTNNGDKLIRISDMFQYPLRSGGTMYTPDGVSLIDTENFKRHRPLADERDGECVCTDWKGESTLNEGEAIDFWIAFPPPPKDTKEMAVTTTVTPDFHGIPLTDAAEVDEGLENIPLEKPKVLDLVSLQDDLDGSASREDSGDETSIMLSSDVLFELNESDLTSKADESLESVAAEIDESSTTVVHIDGYTDNSGNDSINIPLSKDRAKEVKKRLEKLTSRDGLTFETDGHGSSDPVATNGTEEGREKNRRVTISFEK